MLFCFLQIECIVVGYDRFPVRANHSKEFEHIIILRLLYPLSTFKQYHDRAVL